MINDKVLTIKLPSSLKTRIEADAKKENRSLSNYIRLILEKSTKK